jgi:hypothetical protein
MNAATKGMLFACAWLLPTMLAAQECALLKTASIETVTGYLQHAGDDPAEVPCIKAAFGRIAGIPSEQAIEILIGYLAYKRPLNEAERHGFFMHGTTPDVLYPAVYELYVIGARAEPALVDYVATNWGSAGPGAKNALYAMLLIHHGDVVPVIRTLLQGTVSSKAEEARDHLQAAARDAIKWCDEGSRPACEKALR